ncbi:MAG TPA: hypothetical protein VNT79_10585 [Phycisphaerae bacterium]|nr:hypothetical protein [Phycisphaerae bacterium]
MSLTNFFQKELGESARIKLSYHLTRAMILKWADEHYRRYGQWPKEARRRDDYVPLNWTTIGNALKAGRVAGVPERSTLARFLMQARDPTLRVHINTPLSINQILKWADAHHKRTGRWPINTTGRILEATPGETWYSVSGALKRGARGLPGGEYLASLLARERGVLAQGYKPILTHEKILAWAVAHHRRTGKWPTSKSGRVKESPAETWDSIRTSMRDGHRGLPAGITLAALFNSVRGDAGDLDRKGKLSVESIKLWARAQHRRHGKWPDKYSGAVPDARGETWFGIEEAIRLGKRGLPKGRSLSAFLSGLRSPMALPSARRRSTRAVRRSNAN